jgi:hypothetical protein
MERYNIFKIITFYISLFISFEKINGSGIYKWAEGSKYEGEVKNGKRSGLGTFYVSISCIKLASIIDTFTLVRYSVNIKSMCLP